MESGDKMQIMNILQSVDKKQVHQAINCSNNDGWTPLHVSSNDGMTSIVEILIEYGAIIDARTQNFRTPLHMACMRGHFSVIQTLLISGAEVDSKDIDGNTPCHFVAEYGHRDCLRFLLTKHPTLFSKNAEGKSPIDMACSHEILQTFEEYIKSVKNILGDKHKKKAKEPREANKSSSESSNAAQKQLGVDEQHLKERAKTKQIKIFDSQIKAEKKRLADFETTGTLGPNQNSVSSNTTDDEFKPCPANFTPVKLLGTGSFGEVYLVKEKRKGRLFAMKVLSKEKIMGQNLTRYAKTERDVLSYTKHPFIVGLNFAF